ncbi:hypothetical protein K502DRAFT_237284 [Neoconidiobolus thromboides FSU 785]|nr:hypothetical protein K502DRAFT_237284 [Neoconidiobolus thromboides FSU 785]
MEEETYQYIAPRFKMEGDIVKDKPEGYYLPEDGNKYVEIAKKEMPTEFFALYNQLADLFTKSGADGVINWVNFVKKNGLILDDNKFEVFLKQQSHPKQVRELHQFITKEIKEFKIDQVESGEDNKDIEQMKQDTDPNDHFNFLFSPALYATVYFEQFSNLLEKRFHPQGKSISDLLN